MREHEKALSEPILEYLRSHAKIRLLGKPHVKDDDRAATIAFKPLNQTSQALASRLQRAGIGTENGDFYAPRLLEAIGIDPGDGLVRLSLLHYNESGDVIKILGELDEAMIC